MSPEEIKKRVEGILKRHDAVIRKRAGYQGQLEAKLDELKSIVAEVKAAGYDPKNLPAEVEKTQRTLEEMIPSMETQLTEVEAALAVFDNKK
jgi:predicted nuclease with TOPRIM domain